VAEFADLILVGFADLYLTHQIKYGLWKIQGTQLTNVLIQSLIVF
jgi:hypothetical protein